MRRDIKNMDDLLKEKFADFESEAPVDVWDAIDAKLSVSGGKRIAWLYKIAAAIAAIAMIGSLYLFSTKNNDLNNNSIIAKNDTETKLNESLPNNVDAEKIVEQENVIEYNRSEEDIEVKTKQIPKSNENYKIDIIHNNLIAQNNQKKFSIKEDKEIKENRNERIARQNAVPVRFNFKTIESEIANAKFKKSKQTIENNFPDINSLLAINNMLIEEEDQDKNKWILGGEFTPLYSYRHITNSEGNYNAEYYNEGESPVMSYTGGLNLQFKAKDRLTIQAGVYYSSMGQSLDYMTVYANQAYDLVSDEFKDRFINSYELNNSAGNISFNTPYVIVDEIAGRVNNLSSEKGFINTADPIFQNLDAEIQQSFQYIEVPVILRYKLIDKIVDLNIVGGVGANFLVGNDVLLVYGNTKEVIGETKGVNSVSYNGSIGFGIEYPLMKRLNIRLEPSIKYYLNSINTNSSVESHPYSLGIYTGINYTF
ncbi:MAG: outer membrane beta-barrel protein [Bacteroidales bacterium]|nr:outer membrane beta-barrel protein [Bacteroidales bacterium]